MRCSPPAGDIYLLDERDIIHTNITVKEGLGEEDGREVTVYVPHHAMVCRAAPAVLPHSTQASRNHVECAPAPSTTTSQLLSCVIACCLPALRACRDRRVGGDGPATNLDGHHAARVRACLPNLG